MTDALNALADRCEAATGPDRELDVEIADAAGLELAHGTVAKIMAGSPCNTVRDIALAADRDAFFGLPRYTASLDAALTLVPENWKFRQANFSAPCADERKWNAQLHGGREGEDCFTAFAATPALALCAAALRARAQQEGQR